MADPPLATFDRAFNIINPTDAVWFRELVKKILSSVRGKPIKAVVSARARDHLGRVDQSKRGGAPTQSLIPAAATP
jgi:hypothetical protein